ncbi:MAG: hypothetical protein NTX57_22605 [Armatimonadetes bacterium]|nr:hypothetical protein [Armatimonadota bacterium]
MIQNLPPWYNSGIAIRKDIWQGTTCRRCGLTFEVLCDEGLLGCSHCYVTFRGLIEAAIPELHGVTVPSAWMTQRAVPRALENEEDGELASSPPSDSPFTRRTRPAPQGTAKRSG